jgi:uncharacterized protein YjbI with pentapeptide repeats
MNNAFSLILKYLFPFTSWFLGVYITLFVMCFYAHVNESNIVANRADALITEIAHNKYSMTELVAKISSIQSMLRKTKPSLLEPSTIFNSLLGKREPFKLINKILGNAIESRKDRLAGLSLGQVDLEGADLSNADMHGANLKKAILSEANLSGANLVAAKFNLVNFQGARFLNANVYKADFEGANFEEADLGGANFNGAVGLTCEQINSAVIDESTHLPDYIILERSSGSTFNCINMHTVYGPWDRADKGEGLNLSGMNLVNVDLRGSDLNKSNLMRFNLSQANLENSNLSRSRFNHANLSHANLKGSSMQHSYFEGANFEGADLRGANFDRAIGLTCEQINSAVIDESTHLPDYIFLAKSSGPTFKCINILKGEGLNLSGVNLAHVYLRGSDLKKTNLSQTNLEKANLSYSQFNHANLSHANLKGSSMQHSYFEGANFEGADLGGANLNHAIGLTCEQINSAVIDESTHLPHYIFMVGSIGTAYKCENTLNEN